MSHIRSVLPPKMAEKEDPYVIKGPDPYEPIPEGSLGKILYESLLENQSREAMVDGYTGETLTYGHLLHQTCELALALRKYDCDSKCLVAVCSENSLRFFVPVFAALYNGSVVVPINHSYTPYELDHCLNLTLPRIVFCSRAVSQKFVASRKDHPFLEKIIVIDGSRENRSSALVDADGSETQTKFVERHLENVEVKLSTFEPFNDCDPEQQVAAIMSSSGTTGMPKGVMLTHRNIIVRLAQSRDSRFKSPSDSVVLGLMPFFHGYGFNFGLTSVFNRDKIVVLKRFEEDAFLAAVQRYKITCLALAPPLVVFLAKTPKLSRYDFSSVVEIYCGAAPLTKGIEDLLKKRLNIAMIRQGYGLTESNLAVTLMRPTDADKPGSSGRVITYMQLKVVNPKTGRSLAANQVGEICIKGPMVMKGYYRNEQATREAFTADGWLRTGDLGYYDEDEYFFIVDRLKELIKYKGFQVAPAELEAILLNHPKVLDVGVIGVPDELAGELPLAFVVRREGTVISEKELQEFVGNIVSPQKRLRGGVSFVSTIPKNASGKILRRELKKLIPNRQLQAGSKL